MCDGDFRVIVCLVSCYLCMRQSHAGGVMPDYKLYDFDPRKIPPEFLQAIGLVIACSVQTENLVERAISDLLGLKTVPAHILTTHMSMQVRAGVLRSAGQMRWGASDTYKSFDALVTRVEAAIVERNRIAHLTWQTDPETGQIFTTRIQAKRGIKVHLEPITVDAIEAIAAEVYEAGLALSRFVGLAGVSFPPD
jgi:hypothetical protein